LFTELALSGNLTPNYDNGAALHGDLFDNKFSYALGVFNGAVDNGSIDSDIDGNKELAARVFVNPWKGGDVALLDGFGIGFATTLGSKQGTSSSSYLPSYKTPGQQTFYSYRSDVIADGRQIRYSPQAYYSYGSFGLLAEHILSSQEVKRGTNTADISNKAWQIAASYVLTGEQASYKGVKPKNLFNPQKGDWGAFELVGRVSQLNVDDNAFPTFADSTKYAKAAKAWGLGLNWYLNNNVRASLDYEQTGFTGGAPNGDRQNERAILARVQVGF
jgi:phosphate-selective porin OprO/OprP